VEVVELEETMKSRSRNHTRTTKATTTSPHYSRSARGVPQSTSPRLVWHMSIAQLEGLLPAACQASHTLSGGPPRSLSPSATGWTYSRQLRQDWQHYLTPVPTPTQALQRFHIRLSLNLPVYPGLEDVRFMELGIQIALGDRRDDSEA
jgi:hypothetical protein